MQAFVSECLARIRPDSLCCLVQGSCGQLEYAVLGEVANLFVALICTAPRIDMEPLLIAALRQDYFVLGDPAKNAALSILTRCCGGNNISQPSTTTTTSLISRDLECFLQDVWRLHRVEDTDALPLSDEVAWFLEKYSS